LIDKLKYEIKKRVHIGLKFLLYLKKKRKSKAYFKEHNPSYIILIDHPEPGQFQRYFYTFCKYLLLDGYIICIGGGFKVFKQFVGINNYMSLLLKEENVHFYWSDHIQSEIQFDQKNLDVDYFDFVQDGKRDPRHYYIPMSLHPIYYMRDLYQLNYRSLNRKRSVFVAASLADDYQQFDEDKFKMESRLSIISHLKNKNLLTIYTNRRSFENFLSSESDGKCIVNDRKYINIPNEELLAVLNQFDFFLALPGVVMPLSHNLTEAMHMGMIPLIHKNYARLLNPPLEDRKTALIYGDLSELEDKLTEAYTLETACIEEMRTAIGRYYQQFLSPAAVSKEITSGKFQVFKLNGEFASVKRMHKTQEHDRVAS
jgi:hypothetical protein